MSAELYDWQRDDGLDFPDDPRDEPTRDEVDARVTYYETHPYTSHTEGNHSD